jgi:hypothetical protein
MPRRPSQKDADGSFVIWIIEKTQGESQTLIGVFTFSDISETLSLVKVRICIVLHPGQEEPR